MRVPEARGLPSRYRLATCGLSELLAGRSPAARSAHHLLRTRGLLDWPLGEERPGASRETYTRIERCSGLRPLRRRRPS